MRILLVVFACAMWGQEAALEVGSLVRQAQAAQRKGDWRASKESLGKAQQLLLNRALSDAERYAVTRQLAVVELVLGEYEEAFGHAEEALTYQDSRDPKEVRALIADLGLLARIHEGRKDYERCRALWQRMIGYGRELPDADARTAEGYAALAGYDLQEQKPVEALALLQSALRYREKAAQGNELLLLGDLDRLGSAAVAAREYQLAVGAYQRALWIREGAYGRESSELLGTLDGLAYAQFGIREYEVAEKTYLRLLQLWQKEGAEHPMLGVALDKVSVFYLEWGKKEEAAMAQAQASTLRARALAASLQQESAQAILRGDGKQAVALLRWAWNVVEPAARLVELRDQIKANLAMLEKAAPTAKAVKRGVTK